MNKGIKIAMVLAAGLILGGVGWSMADEEKDCPYAKAEAGQGGEKGSEHHAKPGRRPFLAKFFGKCFSRDLLADGYRSLTLPVKEYQLLNIKTGDYVDVLATFDATIKDRKEKVTATLLQHVKVLGVVKTGDLMGKGAIHLMLNPNETQYAALARYQGEIDIALRADSDKALKPMEMASFRKLFTNK
ncbi:MAG: hypothetical protein HY924_02115 [Elusimicrobia bacterium]|nr:hypothetical protein [Elusimicrobiota bacterium]